MNSIYEPHFVGQVAKIEKGCDLNNKLKGGKKAERERE